MLSPLLFPLNRLSQVDVAALQVGLRAAKLSQPMFMRQRLAAYQHLLPPKIPVNMPWDAIGLPTLTDIPVTSQGMKPAVVHQLLPYPPQYFRLTGTTKDSTGAALGACTVDWFNTADDTKLGTTTSDANGLYEFRSAGQPPNAYYLVAYKVGSPDVAGTTVNTLVGT